MADVDLMEKLDVLRLQDKLDGLGNAFCATNFEMAKQFNDVSRQISECCCTTQKEILELKHHNDHNTQKLLDKMCDAEKDRLKNEVDELNRKLLIAELSKK